MKYGVEAEKELMTELWSMNIKDDPLNFVKFVFEWGKEGTPLENFTGPRKWQEKILRDIGIHIQRNQSVDLPEMFRLAVASGRGIGKSALVSWLILWMLSTRLGSTIIVTANTEQQLRSRTWAELGKWLTLAINSHWFNKTATTIRPAQWFEEALIRDLKIDTGYYYAQAQLWSEENPDAFAGIHSSYGVCLIMDEASGIPAPIYSVSEDFSQNRQPIGIGLRFLTLEGILGRFTTLFTANARTGIKNKSTHAQSKAQIKSYSNKC